MGDKHDQKKKHGIGQDKQHKRMHEAVEARHRNAGPEGPRHDREDYLKFKRGSANDTTPRSV